MSDLQAPARRLPLAPDDPGLKKDTALDFVKGVFRDGGPGFAQFASLTESVDDVIAYHATELPAASRAILDAYGAGHVIIERRLMAPADYQGIDTPPLGRSI